MAQFDDFTPNFVATLERMQREGQVYTLAMILGWVGAVRAAARIGRPFAEVAYNRYMASANVSSTTR